MPLYTVYSSSSNSNEIARNGKKKKRKKKKKKEGKKREKIELYPEFIIQLNAKIEISLMRAGTTTSTTSVEWKSRHE